jgi:phosphate transport system substrate-binding protein
MKFATVALAIGLSGLTVAAQAQQITGAGATFPAPIYAKWGEAAKAATGLQLNYQAIGSGGGQTQIVNRTVDFGASDAPMNVDRMEKANLHQFPSVMGAVVVIVNIPGVATNQLKLDGPMVAAIYHGKITKWNDPSIQEMNRGLTLPNRSIAPVYRADGSGTTYVFASYLSAVDPTWKAKVGAATSVKWPTGQGARGNDGMAATVQNTPGGFGYVEFAYAKQNNLATAAIRNKAGQFVVPSMETFTAAASNADWANAKHFAVDLIDQAGEKSWPIVSATFILLPKDPKDPTRSANVMKFMDWAYNSGDDLAIGLDYVPLPPAVKAAVRGTWMTEIKGPDGKPVR